MLTRRAATTGAVALRSSAFASSRAAYSSIVRHGQAPLTSTQNRAASCPFRQRPSVKLATARVSLRHAQLRQLSTEVRAAIDKAVDAAPVVLFMKGTPEFPQCGFSRTTVQILGLQGVDPAKFVAFNVLEDQALRNGIKEYSEWPTIPQLYINKEFVGGCDILMQMHQDGSLSELLEKQGVVLLADGEAEASSEK